MRKWGLARLDEGDTKSMAHKFITYQRTETSVAKRGEVSAPGLVISRVRLRRNGQGGSRIEREELTVRRAASKIARWYGSVTPIEQPEDFRKRRQEFESQVAESVFAPALEAVTANAMDRTGEVPGQKALSLDETIKAGLKERDSRIDDKEADG